MDIKEKLLELNKRGLIHAPDESDEQFFKRCLKACSKSTNLASTLAHDLFDISPDWVGVVYDNKGLKVWEGACTWIGEEITLQLKKAYHKKNSFLGYSYDELIAHELVHVVRSGFEEPVFEEILAYQSSTSSFRRFCAPLFRSTKETNFFMVALAAFVGSSFFEAAQGFALIGFCLLIIAGFVRLTHTQRTFAKAKNKLIELVSEDKVLAVMVRLTDREIIRFSKMSSHEIAAYAQKMSKNQIRWQQIFGAYFTGR